MANDIRVGIIGLDTSHVPAFTQLMNDATHPDHVPGAKVVAAVKGGSPDIPDSANRLEGFTNEIRDKYGVKIVDTIDEMLPMVDAVMIESLDGRPKLEQARPVIKAGKILFIDKPVAGTLGDAIEIYRLAEEAGVPVFTSSSYRYYDSMVELMNKDVGEVRSAISYGPAHLEEHHPDLFWYGVHPVESLFTALGPKCISVARVSTADTDIVTGTWSDGRTGMLVGLRNVATPHKVILFGKKAVAEQQPGKDSYAPLVREIVKFFQTRKPPVSPEETLAMFTFMEAADESKRRGGAVVRMDEVYAKHGGRPRAD